MSSQQEPPAPTPEELAYQEAHAHESRAALVNTIQIMMMVVSLVVVVGRLIARKLSTQPFKADDYTIILSLVLFYTYNIHGFLAVRYGFGRHIWTISPQDGLNFAKVSPTSSVFYFLVLFAIRMSILLLYRRVFVTQKFRIIANALMAFVVACTIASVCATIFRCRPIRYLWDKTIENGTCNNIRPFLFYTAATNLFADVAILLLPIPMVWRLHTNRRRKIALSGIFMIGSFACVAAIVRLAYLLRNPDNTADITWLNVPYFLWTATEPFVGILCACFPIMAPLFQKFFQKQFSTRRSANSQPHHGSSSQWINLGGRSRKGTDSQGGNMIDPYPESIPTFKPAGLNESTKSEVTTGKVIMDEGEETFPTQGIQVKSDLEWSSVPTKTGP